jgi:hypothetical protein
MGKNKCDSQVFTHRQADGRTDRQTGTVETLSQVKYIVLKNKLQLLHRQEAKDLQGKGNYVPGNL